MRLLSMQLYSLLWNVSIITNNHYNAEMDICSMDTLLMPDIIEIEDNTKCY